MWQPFPLRRHATEVLMNSDGGPLARFVIFGLVLDEQSVDVSGRSDTFESVDMVGSVLAHV